jgi:hypothetical protein
MENKFYLNRSLNNNLENQLKLLIWRCSKHVMRGTIVLFFLLKFHTFCETELIL